MEIFGFSKFFAAILIIGGFFLGILSGNSLNSCSFRFLFSWIWLILIHDFDFYSKEFNGEQSEYTQKARKLLEITKEKLFLAYSDDMARLEEKISEAQQRAIDQADVDSLGKTPLIHDSVSLKSANSELWSYEHFFDPFYFRPL